jgi:hypothetical protein
VYSIKEVEGFVQISMDELRSSGKANDMETYDIIVSTIAIFSLQIVAGISKVCAERDNQNCSADQLPPVLPLDCAIYISETLLLLCNSNWSALSKIRMRRLEKLMTSFNLYLAFKEQSGFSQMLQNAQVCFAFQSFEQFGAHWEVSMKTYKGIVRPLQA